MPKSVAFAGPPRSPRPSAVNAHTIAVFFMALPPFPLRNHSTELLLDRGRKPPGRPLWTRTPHGPRHLCLCLLQEAFHNMLLRDMKTGIGDTLAAAAGAAAGGVEMAGGALAEGEAAGEAAGGVDAQTLGAPMEAPLDVAEILFENSRRGFQLPPQLLEPPLPRAQEVDDPLAERRGRFESRVWVVHDQYSAPGGATRVSSSWISRRMRPSIRQRSRRPARLSSPA